MKYSIRISNDLNRIVLSDPTHMMSIANHVSIGVETPKIDSKCSLEKEFTKLIRRNSLMIIIPNCQLG